MDSQIQTRTSFSDKWENNRKLAFSETLREGSDIHSWILNRNGFATSDEFAVWLSDRNKILDAGCGNGRVTALLRHHAPAQAEITGIDLTAAHVAQENLRDLTNLRFEQRDLLLDLSDLGQFDLIYCQEVLHHTSNPRAAFLNLSTLLTDNGEIAIYVYKLKAPLREYADDFIRDKISRLPYEQALTAMNEITEFGRVLASLDVRVNVPAVELLGIDPGEYDIQRLIYHFFLKCFWNQSLTFDENAAINYDWYHPQLCTRHTLEEINSWFVDAGLNVIHQCVDHYGITMRGVKPSM